MGTGKVVDEECWSEVGRQIFETPNCKQIHELTHNATHVVYCKVNGKETLFFHNTYSFLKKVDQLPTGPGWKCNKIEVTGDNIDENGMTMQENVELWHCDPVECVKELIGNPAFKDFISYEAEHVYVDDGAKVRVFNEMWTGDWWWNTQV